LSDNPLSDNPLSDSPWFLFACDHRDSFRSLLRRLTGTAEHDQVVAVKQVLLDGFAAAVRDGLPAGSAVLLDEQYGSTLFPSIRDLGSRLVIPVERSGQPELSMEYGADFGAHIATFAPDGVKVLLRWDPSGDVALNGRQGSLLKSLSDWTHAHHVPLIVEFLTPPITESSQRAGVMAEAIDQIAATGTVCDLWKVEGLDTTRDCQVVADAIGRHSTARAVVLGRGVTLEKAEEWLRAAAPVPVFIGFAIGKTLWQEPLEAHLGEGQPAAVTVVEIARRYRHLVTTWASMRDERFPLQSGQ
jgi:myo-inositol catabolism protein IolC